LLRELQGCARQYLVNPRNIPASVTITVDLHAELTLLLQLETDRSQAMQEATFSMI
jgi:hypothetical protein